MFNQASLNVLLETHQWASRRLMKAIGALSEEQFTQEVGGSFGSIAKTLNHLVGSAELAAAALKGEPWQGLGLERDREVLSQRWEAAEGEIQELVGLVEGPVPFQPPGVPPGLTLTVWQLVHQHVIHGAYHRGQLIHMIRQVGGRPVSTDPAAFHLKESGQIP